MGKVYAQQGIFQGKHAVAEAYFYQILFGPPQPRQLLLKTEFKLFDCIDVQQSKVTVTGLLIQKVTRLS